jgi:hypothetical protein
MFRRPTAFLKAKPDEGNFDRMIEGRRKPA